MADGNLKLGDLGLSRYFSSRTLQATSTVGTVSISDLHQIDSLNLLALFPALLHES